MIVREELEPFTQLVDWEILARLLLGEAEGESELGKLGVACVVRNRVYSNHFPNSYTEVCLQHLQFSCFNEGSNRIALMLHPERSSKAYEQCKRIAKSVIMDSALDITGGADHYLNEKYANPSWKYKMIKTCKIGNHTFYRST